MKTMNKLGPVLGVIAVLTLGACANPTPPPNAPNYGVVRPDSRNPEYGVVQSIELVQQDSRNTGSTIGLGTVAGAVVGGIVGNQVGSGGGRTAATVIGAAGGAYVGHELENRPQQQVVNMYKITVRMENGSYQTVMQSTAPDLRIGDHVVLENGVLQRE